MEQTITLGVQATGEQPSHGFVCFRLQPRPGQRDQPVVWLQLWSLPVLCLCFSELLFSDFSFVFITFCLLCPHFHKRDTERANYARVDGNLRE